MERLRKRDIVKLREREDETEGKGASLWDSKTVPEESRQDWLRWETRS